MSFDIDVHELDQYTIEAYQALCRQMILTIEKLETENKVLRETIVEYSKRYFRLSRKPSIKKKRKR